MHVFYMEFRACEITAWTTEFHTDLHRVIDEVVEQRYEILDSLCWRSKEFTFNPKEGIDLPDNARAIEVFDYLMSKLALKAFEPGSISQGSLEFRLCRRPVVDAESRETPETKPETSLVQPC